MGLGSKVLVTLAVTSIHIMTTSQPILTERLNNSQSILTDSTKITQNRLTNQSRVTINGIGPIKIGMTVQQAEQVGKIQLVQGYSRGDCAIYKTAGTPKEIYFLTTNNRIASVTIRNDKIATISGARVGDSVNKINSLYPDRLQKQKSEVAAHTYYLKFVPKDASDRQYRVFFKVRDGEGEVVSYRFGKLPEVSYPEGCV